jgi:hypothetical protein
LRAKRPSASLLYRRRHLKIRCPFLLILEEYR